MRRVRAAGGWQPAITQPAQKQIGSVRTFAFEAFGGVTTDRTVQATLIASNSGAVGYLDDALAASTDNITVADIQTMLDRFSESTVPQLSETFGSPSDVDNNGQLLFLFTSLVDEVQGVAGFYASSSLFTTNQGGNGNLVDMMYISPTRPINSYESLLAHEFQHLISFNQHVLERNGDAEVVWLNEGLSHYSEDIVGGHTVGGNRDLINILMNDPGNYSLTGDASLNSGIRGAAYLFVRGLVDNLGPNTLSQLVQSAQAGIPNVESVSGQNFQDLYRTYILQLFLSGNGLSTDPTLNYTYEFLTDPLTSRRTLPTPRELRVSESSPSATGSVKPSSAVFIRLAGSGTNQSIRIEIDPTGQFQARLIPLPLNYQPQISLPASLFDGVSLDTLIPGVFASGEVVLFSGNVQDASVDQMILSFKPRNGQGEDIDFQFDVSGGRFSQSIIFSPSRAGEYNLTLFAGQSGSQLPAIGEFPGVVITAGERAVDLPITFFPDITLDTPLQTSFTGGEGVTISGTVSDPSVSQILFSFVSLQDSSKVIEFVFDVNGGQFERSIIFTPSQAGDYELKLFKGQGTSLPFVGSFSPVMVLEGDGSVLLPVDFFSGITLSSPLATQYLVGTGASFSGTVSDPTIEVILVTFTPEGGGNAITIQTNVTNSSFRKGYVFTPDQTGNYTLDVFGGPAGGSVPHRGSFTPITVAGTGSERVFLPIDLFDKILFDEPLSTRFIANKLEQITGQVTDTGITQIGVSFRPTSGAQSIDIFLNVINSQFVLELNFNPAEIGTYEIVLFGGLAGQSLPFLGSFSPVEVLSSRPIVQASQTGLIWESLEVGNTQNLTVAIENIGTEELVIGSILSNNTQFSASPTNATIAPGTSSPITITFSPDSPGEISAILEISSNDPDRSTLQLTLTGSATTPQAPTAPNLQFSLTSLSWENIQVGQTQDLMVVLRNTGTTELILSSISTDQEAFTVSIDSLTIAQGDSASISITFSPVSAGTISGILQIISNDSERSPTQITLTGTASSGTLALDLDLAAGDQGSRSVSQPFETGDSITLDLVVINGAQGISGFQATLSFSANEVIFDGFSATDLLVGAVPITTPGDSTIQLNVVILGANTVTRDNGTLGNATFKILEGFTGESQITLTIAQLAFPTGTQPVSIASGGGTVTFISGSSTPTPDFTGDGKVDFQDFLQFASAFGNKSTDPGFDSKFDLNQDGEVNFPDFLQFAGAFGQ